MKRIAACAWLLAIAVATLGLFHIKHLVQGQETELSSAQESILEHQEAIHVLKAEWSFLNQPKRISELAVRHLDMAPLTAARVVEIADLPVRGAARDQAPGDQSPSDQSQGAATGTALASARRLQ